EREWGVRRTPSRMMRGRADAREAGSRPALPPQRYAGQGIARKATAAADGRGKAVIPCPRARRPVRAWEETIHNRGLRGRSPPHRRTDTMKAMRYAGLAGLAALGAQAQGIPYG